MVEVITLTHLTAYHFVEVIGKIFRLDGFSYNFLDHC